MSSGTESIIEQIELIRKEIALSKTDNKPHKHLEEKLNELLAKLSKAVSLLNEGSQLLKD